MRRFSALIAITALCVVSAVLCSSAQTNDGEDDAIVTNHIISDSFEGTSISPKVWGFYGTNQPNNITLTQKDDALYVSVSSAATNDFTAGLTTRCKLRGDFDAVLSFKLVTWPPKNGVWLNLGTDSPFNVYRVTWQYDTGDDYGAYLPPAGAIAPASGNSGVLRLSRLAGKWTAYYLSGSNWVALASGLGPTSDIALGPGVFNLSNVLPFGGAATTVAFNGFHAIAAAVVCPN